MVLSLIGGIFILIGGAILATAGSFISGLGTIAGFGAVGNTLLILGIVGVIFGLLVIVGGVMMYVNPAKHTMWGVIVLVLSILSWVTAIGGLVIGFLLGLIGGILGLVFKPSMAPSPMPPSGMGAMPTSTMAGGMTCRNCGASIPMGATKCPSCGASV